MSTQKKERPHSAVPPVEVPPASPVVSPAWTQVIQTIMLPRPFGRTLRSVPGYYGVIKRYRALRLTCRQLFYMTTPLWWEAASPAIDSAGHARQFLDTLPHASHLLRTVVLNFHNEEKEPLTGAQMIRLLNSLQKLTNVTIAGSTLPSDLHQLERLCGKSKWTTVQDFHFSLYHNPAKPYTIVNSLVKRMPSLDRLSILGRGPQHHQTAQPLGRFHLPKLRQLHLRGVWDDEPMHAKWHVKSFLSLPTIASVERLVGDHILQYMGGSFDLARLFTNCREFAAEVSLRMTYDEKALHPGAYWHFPRLGSSRSDATGRLGCR